MRNIKKFTVESFINAVNTNIRGFFVKKVKRKNVEEPVLYYKESEKSEPKMFSVQLPHPGLKISSIEKPREDEKNPKYRMKVLVGEEEGTFNRAVHDLFIEMNFELGGNVFAMTTERKKVERGQEKTIPIQYRNFKIGVWYEKNKNGDTTGKRVTTPITLHYYNDNGRLDTMELGGKTGMPLYLHQLGDYITPGSTFYGEIYPSFLTKPDSTEYYLSWKTTDEVIIKQAKRDNGLNDEQKTNTHNAIREEMLREQNTINQHETDTSTKKSDEKITEAVRDLGALADV